MSEIINWNLEKDKTKLNSAMELMDAQVHNRYMSEYSQMDVDDIKQRIRSRMDLFVKAPVIMKTEFHGTVLEMGCGAGVLSCNISKLPNVNKVIALDYSRVAVEELLPIVIEKFGANKNKITCVHGSFNAMELDDNSVDFIVSTGTLHHAEDLAKTAKECFRVLKPGGWCVHVDRVFGSQSERIKNKTGLKKQLKKEKLSFRYGKAYEDKNITSEMLSTHWLHVSALEHHFLKEKFIVHSVHLINTKYFKLLFYLIYKILGNFLLQNSHIFSTINVPIYPWFVHEASFKGQNYKNLLFLCQKPSQEEHIQKNKHGYWIRLLRYIFIDNRKLDKNFRKEIENILKI